MIIARQRFGKHVPKVRQSTVEGPLLLRSKSLGTFRSKGQTQNITEELFEMVIYIRFSPSYKRGVIRKRVQSFI
jgi:hypothetical protein